MRSLRKLFAVLLTAVVSAAVIAPASAMADDPYIKVNGAGATQSTAIDVVPGQLYYQASGYWNTLWNEVTLNSDGYIVVAGTPEYGVDLAVYDASTNKLVESGFNDNYHTFHCGLTAGTYYVKFSNPYSNSHKSTLLYSIDTFNGVSCEIEPNDTFSDATTIRVDQKYLAFWTSGPGSFYDPDYFSISLNAGSSYKLMVDNYEGIGKPTFKIYESDRSTHTRVSSTNMKYDAAADMYCYDFTCSSSATYFIYVNLPKQDSMSYVLQVKEVSGAGPGMNPGTGDITTSGFEYVVSGGKAVITGFSGSSASLSIPSKIDGYAVTAIDDAAFCYNKSLRSIVFPSTIKSIGEQAFIGCENLSTINLPEGLTSIESLAFSGCTALESVVLPASLRTLGSSAFADCAGLSSITVNSRSLTCDYNVFMNSGYLSDGIVVEFGSSCTKVSENFFSATSAATAPYVTEVTIAESVAVIEPYAFRNCSDLHTLEIEGDGLEEIGYRSFENCSSLMVFYVPTSVQTFGHYAFYGFPARSFIYLYDGGPWAQYDLLIGDPTLFYEPNRTSVVLLPDPNMENWETFPDVKSAVNKAGGPEKVWYVADGWLDYVVDNELMGGYTSNGYFGPNDTLTRGQVATILYRAECAADPSLIDVYGSTTDSSDYAKTSSFKDLKPKTYCTAAINWAKDVGIMTGDASTNYKTVRPNDPVTRQELCVMLARYANGGVTSDAELEYGAGAGIRDLGKVSSWAEGSVNWAINNGIISGSKNSDGTYTLNPGGKTTRAAAAKMLTVTLRDVM